MPNSYLQTWIQRQIASGTFPAHREDWYTRNSLEDLNMSLEERFTHFEQAQRQPEALYYDAFRDIELNRYQLDVTLANQSHCQTEVVKFQSTDLEAQPISSGQGKHIIYFTGMSTLYQDCFKDITDAVKITGATYYGFEYPGMVRLGGEVLEVNDLVNTGLAVTNDLLQKGVDINDIIFQGDSFGAAVAKKISNLYRDQCGVEIRCILNNTFSTFEAGVKSVMEQTSWMLSLKAAKAIVHPALRYVGWDIRTGDNYGNDTPYQVHVNHIGDLTLGYGGATLAELVESNIQLQNFVDPCPEDFRAQRDSYAELHWAQITPEGEEYLATKYGRNSNGQVDTHLADLHYFMYPDGRSVYEALVCTYIRDSNEYIARHPQVIDLTQLPQPLGSETVSLFELCIPPLPQIARVPDFLRFFQPARQEAIQYHEVQSLSEPGTNSR